MPIYKLPAIDEGLLRATGSLPPTESVSVRVENAASSTLDNLRNGVRAESAQDVAFNHGEVESTAKGDYLFVTETVTTASESYEVEVLKTDVGAGSSGLQSVADPDAYSGAAGLPYDPVAHQAQAQSLAGVYVNPYAPPPPESEFYYEPAPSDPYYYAPETSAPVYQQETVATPVEQQAPAAPEPIYYVRDDGYGGAEVWVSYDGAYTFQYQYSVGP